VIRRLHGGPRLPKSIEKWLVACHRSSVTQFFGFRLTATARRKQVAITVKKLWLLPQAGGEGLEH
jgi:hypothetical protein